MRRSKAWKRGSAAKGREQRGHAREHGPGVALLHPFLEAREPALEVSEGPEHGRALAGRDEGGRGRGVERRELAAGLLRSRPRARAPRPDGRASPGRLRSARRRAAAPPLPLLSSPEHARSRARGSSSPGRCSGRSSTARRAQPELLLVLPDHLVEEAAKPEAEAGEGVDRRPRVDGRVGPREVAGEGQEEPAPQVHGGLARGEASWPDRGRGARPPSPSPGRAGRRRATRAPRRTTGRGRGRARRTPR